MTVNFVDRLHLDIHSIHFCRWIERRLLRVIRAVPERRVRACLSGSAHRGAGRRAEAICSTFLVATRATSTDSAHQGGPGAGNVRARGAGGGGARQAGRDRGRGGASRQDQQEAGGWVEGASWLDHRSRGARHEDGGWRLPAGLQLPDRSRRRPPHRGGRTAARNEYKRHRDAPRPNDR